MNNTDGILEVLLVNARGIRHTNLVGTPSYYVLIECGSQCQISKVSAGKHGRIWWNEKFTFEFSPSDCKDITHFKCRIMDKELFTKGGFVGETIVYIGGIITEGTNQGYIEIKPAPYNVVLEDDTYKGQIKIGFKFIAKNIMGLSFRKGNSMFLSANNQAIQFVDLSGNCGGYHGGKFCSSIKEIIPKRNIKGPNQLELSLRYNHRSLMRN